MTTCFYEREAVWPPRWPSKQFISLRSLSSPDSHRSDMTDQDKWSGSDVRSVQSSNCPRQKQKGTLSTRLSSLQCLFNSFHPHCVPNITEYLWNPTIGRWFLLVFFPALVSFYQFLISLDLWSDFRCSFMTWHVYFHWVWRSVRSEVNSELFSVGITTKILIPLMSDLTGPCMCRSSVKIRLFVFNIHTVY